MFARVFIVAVVSFIHTESAVLTGKGLFCRDPDTGKLHSVNVTWSSTTFCGNYACKLRILNQTSTVQVPIRQFNVTNVFLQDATTTESTNKSTSTPGDIGLTPETKTELPIPKILNDDYKHDSNDRYLTEHEIQSIANVLHKVKKSDLDALVEVYTLAQEIYREMDKVTDQEAVDESVNNLKEKIQNLDSKSTLNYNANLRDMEGYSTDSVSVTSKFKKESNINKILNPTYFSGPLTFKDFGKVPYYYPISSFQRMSSYVHQPTPQVKVPAETPIESKTERMKEKRILYPKASDETKDSQKLIQPSYLLPYPFSYVHKYNVSKNANMYSNNPWVWDYYYRNKQSPYLKAYFAHVPPYTGAILVNPHLHDQEEVQDIEQPVVKKPEDEHNEYVNQEPWKTQPLSDQIINEIKANMDTSHRIKKAFPLRKKVKLEKVGKVIKMEELSRIRRDTNNLIENIEKKETVTAKQATEKSKLIELVSDEYEAYIEKITCQPQTVPGYFRYGNLTEPYPHCCPQLIRNR